MENIMSSKLFTTRQGTILLGVIAAVIAAIALLVYLNHYRNSVGSTAEVSVLVANRLIPAGMSGKAIANSGGDTKASFYAISKFPKSSVENGAIVDPATISNQVALHDIAFGQQLTASDFAPGTNSLQDQLGRTQSAVVVPLGSPQAVGGQITAGSHVDVWVAFNGQLANGVSRPITRLLYQDMYVLNAGTNGGNVTLRANNSRQAGTLIYASQNAEIWLVLRPVAGGPPTKAPVISSNDLLGLAPIRVGR